MPTLHVYLDESGDFTFSQKGSRYYIFAATFTDDPQPLATSLVGLQISLMKAGADLTEFHATNDRQQHRDQVVSTLAACQSSWRFAAVVIDKRKVNPVLRDVETFYPKFATPLFRFILRGCRQRNTDRVLICTDGLPNRKKQAISKALKSVCRIEMKDTPFTLHHHPSISNKWLQVADYCCWAVQRKWEKGDSRTYDLLRPRMKAAELDLCAWGDQTTYY